MDESLSAASQRAFWLARYHASQRGGDWVDLADLIVGLLSEDETEAAALVRSWGVDSRRLLESLRIGRIDRPPQDESSVPELPWTRQVHQVVSVARERNLEKGITDPLGSKELLLSALDAVPRIYRLLEKLDLDESVLTPEPTSKAKTEPKPVPKSAPRPSAQTATSPGSQPEPPTAPPPRPQPVLRDVSGPPASSLDEPLPLGDDFDKYEPLPDPERDEADLARLADANLNRACEALRVLEDIARFVRDDRPLCQQLKEYRHELRKMTALFPVPDLVTARDTLRDVGTTVSTADEYSRADLTAVLTSNSKRIQEALRLLEECAKVRAPAAAKLIERIRYGMYAIEKKLVMGERSKHRLERVNLYWLLNPSDCIRSLENGITEAAAGGVGAVQLRDKGASDRELLTTAHQIRKWTSRAGILFIVNDRPDLARLTNADGVHLGQDDLPVKEARRILGTQAIVGVSTHSLEQARAAVDAGADYIGVGPCFASSTKSFESHVGTELVRRVASEIRIPLFAIGGINESNVAQIRAAGGNRVAVGAVLGKTEDPRGVASQLSGGLRG